MSATYTKLNPCSITAFRTIVGKVKFATSTVSGSTANSDAAISAISVAIVIFLVLPSAESGSAGEKEAIATKEPSA